VAKYYHPADDLVKANANNNSF